MPFVELPIYTPPIVPPTTPLVGGTPALLSGATSGSIPVPDYGPHLTAIATELSNIAYSLQSLNYNVSLATEPAGPAAFSQVAAGSLNDIAGVMARMLLNQNETTSAIQRIQLALAGVAGAVGEGVATNQILASSTLKKHQKETAETEAAITASGRSPTTQTPTDFQTKINETIADASDVAIQAKATGFVSRSISGAIEKTYNFADDQVLGPAANFIKKQWNELIGTKVTKPEDTSASAAVTKSTVTRAAKLGL
jgi:hypothetical protein